MFRGFSVSRGSFVLVVSYLENQDFGSIPLLLLPVADHDLHRGFSLNPEPACARLEVEMLMALVLRMYAVTVGVHFV